MNTDYKTGKLLQIIKEWEARGLSEFEISGTEISRAVFFYREANKKFVPIPKGSYTVTMLDSSKANKLLITNKDIQTKAVEYQICYEDEQISSLYIEDFPELDVLVGKYNDVVNDIRNIIQLLKTLGVKADTSQMTQVLTRLQANTFWYLNANGELDAFPIGDLNSKYQDMLENMKKNVKQTLNSVYQALKTDLENLIRNYNTVVEQAKDTIENKKNSSKKELKDLIDNHSIVVDKAKEDIQNLKTSAETSVGDKKIEAINALDTLKTNLENQLNSLKNDISNDLSSELQTHLQTLSSSVNQYISNNSEALKGEKGDKGDSITSIKQTDETSIEVKYGNKKTIVNIPRANSITGLIYENDILKINLSDGTNKQVEIQSGSKLKKLFEIEYAHFHSAPQYIVANLPRPLLDYKKIILTANFKHAYQYILPSLEINLSEDFFDISEINRIKNLPLYKNGNGNKVFISLKDIRGENESISGYLPLGYHSAFSYSDEYFLPDIFFLDSEKKRSVGEYMRNNNILFGFIGCTLHHVLGKPFVLGGISGIKIWGEEK